LIKAGIGTAILIAFGFLPLRMLFQTSSVQAVINSRLVTLRAPIEGRIAVFASPHWQSFDVVPEGTALMQIINDRANPTRLEDVRRQLEHAQNERVGIIAKLTAAKLLQERLSQQFTDFKTARILQLEARSAEQKNSVTAAEAKRQEASDAVARSTTLFQSGNVTAVDMNRLTRELTQAQQSLNSANNRLEADRIELESARAGVLIGDGFNDRPISAQRLDDVTQRIVDLTADLAVLDAEIPRLEKATNEEQARLHINSEAEIVLPIQGRIWEILTSPGEQVRAGQDLLKILDCSRVMVTANVTEATYNQLQVGSIAEFVPSDGGAQLQGRVMSLTGVADAPANFAISPASLAKEPYRVTVSFPKIGTTQDCAVGRTGRVVFSRDTARSP
jgi:multidrug resistance efflux pump